MENHEYAAELADSQVLHAISTQLINEARTEDLYQKIADAACTIMRSEFSSLQMYWPERGAAGELQLLAFRGFSCEAAKFWTCVTIKSASSCGEALRQRTRIIVPSVEHCPFMAEDLSVYLGSGIRSVQSTPLLSRDGSIVGMLSTHWRVPHEPSDSELCFLDILARQAADLIERRRVHDELESQIRERTAEIAKAHESLRLLSIRLMRAQDEERRRISRELHDSAGQMLLAISCAVEESTRNASDPAAVVRCLSEANSLLDQLGKEIRTTSYLLHPPLLDECGLGSAIGWYVDGISKRSGLAIALNVPEDLGRLTPELETAIFRIVQECLTNIHRHSGSDTARIVIARDAESVTLRIEDDGRGIPAEILSQRDALQTGVGLAGMRERVHHLNGKMQIDSSPGGTKVLFMFPVAAVQRAIGMASAR